MFGLDFLALPKYENVVLREFPNGWALGCFAETFGDAFPSVRKVLETGRCPHVRIHLLWSDTHTFGTNDIPTIRALARKYERLATRFPSVRVELSPFCEHNIPNPDPYLGIINQEAPSCIPINTPWQGGISRRYKNEIHGDHKKPRGKYNFSFDGTSAVDADVQSYKRKHKDADIFFFWVPQFNGKKNASDPTPRPERRAWPTSELIDSVIYLRKKRGKVSFAAPRLWKSHADQHEVPPEPRALKPVIIIPEKVPELILRASNGQVVATAPYYGPYTGGGHRYYLPDFGYLVAEKAVRIQGSPVVQVYAKNKLIGTVNPAFRAGIFRD